MSFSGAVYQGGGVVTGTVFGRTGADTIIGGNSDDRIVDTGGRNWIVGGGGDDTVTIGNGPTTTTPTSFGAERPNGPDTSANDTLRFNDSEVGIGVNVFLGAGFVESLQANRPLVALINGFENAVGTGYADALIGSDANNILDGGFNADWHVGGAGADTFRFSNAFGRLGRYRLGLPPRAGRQD